MELPVILENDGKSSNQVNGPQTKVEAAAAPAEHLVTSKEREFLARVCWLLHDVGTLALRSTFDSIHPALTLKDHLAHVHVKSVLQKLHQQEVFTDAQWKQLYPPHRRRRKVKVVTSEGFDTKVLVVMLQTVCHLTPPYPYGWHAEPLPTDSSLSADVVRLQLKYQEVGALSGLRKDEYPVMWDEASQLLQRLGNNEVRVRIQRIENEVLPVEQQAKYIGLVKGAWAPQDCQVLFSKLQDLEGARRGGSRGSKSAYKRKEGAGDEGIPPEDRVVMTKCYKLLQDNVMAEDVLDRLQQGQVIKVTDRQEILANAKNFDRMQVLLPKVMKCPIPYAFKLFCDAIKFKYPRLYDTVMKTRKAVYKQGVHETVDVVGLIREGLETHYKDVFSQLLPLAWSEVSAKVNDYYCNLHLIDSDGNQLSLEELLPAQNHISRGTRVVLEGFAGSGKSTMATMASYLWATQPHYFRHAYKFLLYADAHAMRGSFQEEVYNQLLPPNFKVAAGEFWMVVEANAKDTLLLVDGFEGGQGSAELLDIVQGKQMRGCAVLALARPEAKITGFVNPDYKLLNLGLKPSGVTRVMRAFTRVLDKEKEEGESPEEPDMPPEDLKIGPCLASPYACTVVLAVYRILGAGPLRNIATLTDLFQQYQVAMATQFCQTQELEMEEGQFPEQVIRTVSQLESLAYNTFKSKKLALTDEDLLQIPNSSALTTMGAISRQGPGLRWKFACSLLMDFLSARFLPEVSVQHLLKSPRTASIVAFAAGLYRADSTSDTLLKLFREMAQHNSGKSKRLVFNEDASKVGPSYVKSGSVKSYSHSLMALVECEGRNDVVEILRPSFPKLIQLCDTNIIHRTVYQGLAMMVSHPKIVITTLEINLIPLHLKQRQSFVSLASAFSGNPHLKTIMLAWSCVELMSEFLKTCLAPSPHLQTLHVEDCTRRPLKTIEAFTWANVQDFCACLSNVNQFLFTNCKTPALTIQVVRSLPPCLKSLNLSRSHLNTIGADELGKFMESSTGTKTLILASTDLNSSDLSALFQGIKRCDTLTHFSLKGIKLDRIGMAQLVEFIKLSTSIQDLDLGGMKLSVELCSLLASVLNESRSLKRVAFEDSAVPPEGQEILEKASLEKDIYMDGFENDVDSMSVVSR